MRLALPVVVVQVGMMLLGVVDTMVVGHLSSEALAAVALGHVAIIAVSSFGIGMLLALDPLVAQAVGAGDTVAVRRSVQRGMVLAIGLMVPTTLLFLDADDGTLARRYAESRRPHPMNADTVEEAITGEREMLEDLRGDCKDKSALLVQLLRALARGRGCLHDAVLAIRCCNWQLITASRKSSRWKLFIEQNRFTSIFIQGHPEHPDTALGI